MPAEVLSTVTRTIADTLGIAPTQVTEDADLASLGCDSLDRLELRLDLEEVFCVEVDDDTVQDCVTVSDVVRAVECALAGKLAEVA